MRRTVYFETIYIVRRLHDFDISGQKTTVITVLLRYPFHYRVVLHIITDRRTVIMTISDKINYKRGIWTWTFGHNIPTRI